MKKIAKIFIRLIMIILCGALGYQAYRAVTQYVYENTVLKQIISRLEADSRVAEVLVTGVNYNEVDRKTYTTIKFLEYDSAGRPMEPKYYTFSGNIIQFQSLVVRFDDMKIRQADQFKGKSAYLFWKAFVLDGEKTQEYEIAKINQIPRGYRLEAEENPVEAKFWSRFWEYALDPKGAMPEGIKNAQIEAPGTMFVPGNLYTIKIEHDGGLRIDAAPLSKILLGEKIPL
ncbi:MAG: hypothetical protein JW847_09450 [Candidatus Omnitrophica bacterium]|nr:hypothetical protein [Candidatus Omnitrophota bacterium]